VAPYLLRVRLDGAPVLVDTVVGSGARQDHPLYVFGEVPAVPGVQRLEVTFERLGDTPVEKTGEQTAPSFIGLDVSIDPAAGEVLLVTYDAQQKTLVLSRGD
jgi:hypothetical protein